MHTQLRRACLQKTPPPAGASGGGGFFRSKDLSGSAWYTDYIDAALLGGATRRWPYQISTEGPQENTVR